MCEQLGIEKLHRVGIEFDVCLMCVWWHCAFDVCLMTLCVWVFDVCLICVWCLMCVWCVWCVWCVFNVCLMCVWWLVCLMCVWCVFDVCLMCVWCVFDVCSMCVWCKKWKFVELHCVSPDFVLPRVWERTVCMHWMCLCVCVFDAWRFHACCLTYWMS